MELLTTFFVLEAFGMKKVIHVIWAESHRAAFNTYQQLFVSEAFK
jgi:hypothetical protein